MSPDEFESYRVDITAAAVSETAERQLGFNTLFELRAMAVVVVPDDLGSPPQIKLIRCTKGGRLRYDNRYLDPYEIRTWRCYRLAAFPLLAERWVRDGRC